MLVRTGSGLGELGGCQFRDRFVAAVRGEFAGQPAVYLADEVIFPLNRRGLKSRGAATGRYGLAACAWSLAQVSLRPRVRLKTSRPGVESGSGQK